MQTGLVDRVPNSRDVQLPSRVSHVAIQEGEDRLLRVADVATLLGLSTRAVWALRSEGALDAVKVGGATRFRLSDVQRIVREGVAA